MIIPKVTLSQIGKTIEYMKDKEEELKQLLRFWFSSEDNIDVFSQFIFPEHIKGNVQEFHKDFYDIFFRDGNDALGAPRGHAKSTTIGVVFISFNVVNKRKKYIVYISQNHTKTVQFVDPLRYEFKNNARLRWLYGDLSPSSSRDEEGRDREDCVDINGIRIEAVSFNKNLRGFKFGNMRPDLIIGDDIDDDERVINPVLREKDRDKLLKIIIPSLDINGQLKMVGTIIHHDCLLKNRLNKYDGKVYQAIKDDGSPLWAERFTQKKLDDIKEDIGSAAFESEYMNNPISNTNSLIKMEWVESCYYKDLSVSDVDYDEVYMGVDFAFSDRVSADDSAFVDIGVIYNSNGSVKNLVLLNIEWGHGLSLKQHWEKIQNKYDANKHDMIILEENSIKGSVDDLREFNIPYRTFWMGSKDSVKDHLPSNKSKTISKINSINRLAVSFEYKKWIIPYKTEHEKTIANKLCSELITWALVDGKLAEFGKHADAPIGLILVNEFIRSFGGGVI